VARKCCVLSINAGIGVDFEMMLRCMEYLDQLLSGSSKTHHNKALASIRSLAGFNVKVGKYFGFADDGACVIPWDIDFDVTFY